MTRNRRLHVPARHPAVPMVLSFCSAFVDVVCFLGLYHSFTAFITGTLIILCSELFQYDSLLWLRAVVLGTFLVSALFWIRFLKWMLARNRPVLRLGLALECVFLVLFAASALLLPVGPTFPSPGTMLALIFGTVAMSLQNAIMQIVLNYHVPTTVMTGNFMRFLIASLERRETPAAPAERAPATMNHYGWSLLCFLAGGATGALCLTIIGFWGMLLPAAAIAALAIFGED